MSGSYDILIVGIGGQGTILASNILGEACLTREPAYQRCGDARYGAARGIG